MNKTIKLAVISGIIGGVAVALAYKPIRTKIQTTIVKILDELDEELGLSDFHDFDYKNYTN